MGMFSHPGSERLVVIVPNVKCLKTKTFSEDRYFKKVVNGCFSGKLPAWTASSVGNSRHISKTDMYHRSV